MPPREVSSNRAPRQSYISIPTILPGGRIFRKNDDRKEVTNKDVGLSHLIYDVSQLGRPPNVGMSMQLHSIHLGNCGDPSFQPHTEVY